MLCLTFIDFYVFRAIVSFVTVDVVYYFACLKWSAEDRFCYYAVFWFPVEFPIGFAFSFVNPCLSVGFTVSIFRFPPCRVTFRV